MKKFVKKETCYYFYQVIVESRHRSVCYAYSSYRSARMCYKVLNHRAESDFSVQCLVIRCVCQRFNNSGNLYIGFGKTKDESYKDSLRDENSLSYFNENKLSF